MKQKTARFFLGIDGGGTKTAFMLCDAEGEVIRKETFPGCNPIDIGIEQAETILRRGITAVCEGIDLSSVSVFAGIAGGTSGDNREKLRLFLDTFGFACTQNDSDAMNAVAAGLGDNDGVAVIMGTGCVAFTKSGKSYIRTGGFGYLIDEGGDGYSIGRDALRYALYAEQRKEPGSFLMKALREKAGGSIMEHLGDIYVGGKAYIASFCPSVFEAMRAGDGEAFTIIQNNIRSLSKLIAEAADKLPVGDKVTVVLLGTVAGQPEIMPMLETALGNCGDKMRYTLSVSDTEPVIGAVKLAMEGTRC